MVVIEKLSKVAHFLAVKSTNLTSEVTQKFIKEIVRLHGVPKKIILNRDETLNSRFCKEVFVGFGRKLDFNIAYHPQTDRQTERTNRIFKDMLRMYVMKQPRKWEEYIPLV